MKKKIKSLGLTFLVFAMAVFGFNVNLAQAATYTLADVAAHNTAADCWTVVSSNVYNLTSYISQHPGGPSLITLMCGIDGTLLLNSSPHGTEILPVVANDIIGTLAVTPVLTSVGVTPTTSSILVGGTAQLTAAPMDAAGAAFVGATTTFTSSDVAVATVDASTGMVTGVAAGTATITATSVSGATTVTGSATVTVTPVVVTPVLTSVGVTPATASVAVGGTAQLTAAPMDQTGAAFVGATTTFSSSDEAVATVDASTGMVTGVAAGTATITATSVSGATTVTGAAVVTVTAVTENPVLTDVIVTPVATSMEVGGTLPVIAAPVDQNGAPFVGATTTFSSSDETIATVDNTGVVTALTSGTVTIVATSVSGDTIVTGTATITIGDVVLPGALAAEDFGVVNYDSGLGILKGYTAGFGLTDATFAGVQSVVVKLYAGDALLQTNTATSKVGATLTGAQISSPFDVSGTFDYATDGYWTNVRETQYGQSVPATRVVATVTLANGKVVTAENTNLTGDPTTIFPVTGSGTTPSISGITAPTVLKTGQMGTWKINASDPQDGSLTYTVDWGETAIRRAAASFVQTATFTHTYTTPGTYTITFTVTSEAGTSAVSTITVHVVQAPIVLTSVGVTPDTSTIIVGGTAQLTASPMDQNGVAFVGATTTFSSSDVAVATVDASTGLVTGVSNGTATITATSVSGTVTVTGTAEVIVAPLLSSVGVTPATSSIVVGNTETLTASPLDQTGAAYVGATTTFSSSDETVATVDSVTGVVTGVAVGTATITATSVSGDVIVTGTAEVTVTPVPILTNAAITPDTSSITVTGTETLAVSLLDQTGAEFVGATTTFESSDPSIATVDNAGLVTGMNFGTVTITATSVAGDVTLVSVATVTVETTPVITSLSGPTTVGVGETETVTVNALDPQDGNLSYSVDWGDTTTLKKAALAFEGTPFVQTASFSHIYLVPGTYTATFTVMNDAGEKTSSTIDITVTGPSVLASVTVTPATSSVEEAGGTVQLTAAPMDQNGVAFDGATTTFASSDETVATVDNTGLVTTVANGTATITATSVSGDVKVTGTTVVTVGSDNIRGATTHSKVAKSSKASRAKTHNKVARKGN